MEQLISYIRKVRLGQQHSDKEEVYDSQDDVRKIKVEPSMRIFWTLEEVKISKLKGVLFSSYMTHSD